jgi:hypothetical protein
MERAHYNNEEHTVNTHSVTLFAFEQSNVPPALDLYTNGNTTRNGASSVSLYTRQNSVNKATSNHKNGFYYAFMAERNDMIRACVLTSSEATCPSKLSGANVVASIANSSPCKPPSGASGLIV